MELENQAKTGASVQFLTPKNTTKQPTKTGPVPLKTTNTFDALQKTGNNQSSIISVDNKQHSTRTWIPPIGNMHKI